MNKSTLRVGFLTALDPADKKSWSGIYNRMLEALQAEFTEVVPLGPIKLRLWEKPFLQLYFFCSKVVHRLRYGKKFNVAHTHTLSKIHGAYFSRLLQNQSVDVIFAPASSVEIAHLQTTIPICYYSDATFELICDYYEVFKNLSEGSIKESHEIEQLAIKQSKSQVFSSQWAINSAKKKYHASQTYLVKMGANIDNSQFLKQPIKKSSQVFRIVFIGVDWVRKGGPLVIETLDILAAKDLQFRLIICGCKPEVKRNYLEIIPFLDKNNPEDAKQLEQLLRDSTILFMPTRADCTPIAFCEANAYGLPVISTDTGGVRDVIDHGVNGLLLPYEAGATEYAQLLESLMRDDKYLENLSTLSRKKFEDELNWHTWAKNMKNILIHTAKN